MFIYTFIHLLKTFFEKCQINVFIYKHYFTNLSILLHIKTFKIMRNISLKLL